ncbi:MAG: enoyl-CoA hydratase/isomerase family protein, partial [Nitrococcus sp.]|nr:enoyl-CoA hydratase/isomerase family protein [Nitrococcus sp.]
MSDQSVLFEERPAKNGRKLGFARLNAERSLNALSQAMIDALQARLSDWAQDPAIVCVVIEGSGAKAFCAGGDVIALYDSMRAHPGGPNPVAKRFFETEYRLDYQIHTYPKPVLCWGHGIVIGGGLGLMAGASHRVVTETSHIAMPEITIGLYPDIGATWFLNRMPGRVGSFLG